MTHSLLFDDSIELIDPDGLVSGGSYWFEALAGTTWGNPQPVEVVLNSLMRDGMLTQTESVGNREISVALRICASDPLGLQDGMDALYRAVGKRTTLVWTPPDGYADTRVYEVETSSIETGDGDWDLEYLRNEVRVRLRLVCQPYWRETELTTEVAEGIPSVGTVVNAGTSTANWSTPPAEVQNPNNTTTVVDPQPANMVAVDESAVAAKAYRVGSSRVVGGLGAEDARRVKNLSTLTQAITVAAGAYLSFEVKFDVPVGRMVSYNGGGGSYQETGVLDTFAIAAGAASRTYYKVPPKSGDRYLTEAIVQATTNGFTRYTFRIDQPMSITGLSWAGDQLVPYTDDPAAADRPRIKVRNIAVAETATLGKQVLKTLGVGGSARTTGSLHVAAPSDAVALGKVLAFTVPQSKVSSGFRPDLRQWATTGATSTNNAPPSGAAYNSLGTTYGSTGSPVFVVPASMFKNGAYTIAALAFHANAAAYDLSVEASLMIGGTVVATEELVTTVQQQVAEQGTWRYRVLGTMYLPAAAIQSPSTAATVRFRFKSAAGASLDEVFALPTEGDLTIVDCGSGTVGATASSHLWIDSPSPEQPQGGYWRAATPLRADALSAWSSTAVPGVHTFDAGQMLAFVSATDAQGPTVSFDFYKRRP